MKNNLSKRLISTASAAAITMSVLPAGTVFAEGHGKDKTAHMIGNAHIDAAWKWTLEESIREAKTTFSRAVDLMEKNPDYHFTQSASLYYQWLEEYYPELFEKVKGYIEEGRWEIAGGQVVEPDLNTTGGESIVRQSLYAQRYFKDNFNKTAKVAWVPDCFGFNYNMPQILKKSGMDYFVTTKLNWNKQNAWPYEVFNWQGLDGTEVITYKPAHDYVWNAGDRDFTPEMIAGKLDHDVTLGNRTVRDTLYQPVKYGLSDSIVLYGRGDHGGGPVQRDIDLIKRADEDPEIASVKMGTVEGAFEVIQESVDNGAELPTVNDELYLEIHRGTYTSEAAIKKYNRDCEIAAEEAEKLSTIAHWLGAAGYPKDKIDLAWNKINTNQFHDILPGSCIQDVCDEAWNNAEIALNYLNKSKDNAVGGINSRINTEGEGTPVVVYNSLSWDRKDIVQAKVTLDEKSENVKICDSEGNEIPAKVKINGKRVTAEFEAEVPSMGYEVYRVIADKPSNTDTTLSVDESEKTMENKYFIVEINEETGNIKRIYDKINDKEVIAEGKEANVLQTYRDGSHYWDAWDIAKPYGETDINSVDSIKLVEDNAVKATYRVTKSAGSSKYVQDITIYSNIDRIDIKNNIDWHESHKALKVAFPVAVTADKATYEIPYGFIKRSTKQETSIERARYEVNGHKWADLSDGNYGVSILNNAKYGWDTVDNQIRLTLLKSGSQPTRGSDNGGPIEDQGLHEFTYSIYPHANNWEDANTVRKGYELNYPLAAEQVTKHSGDLDISKSFVSVDKDNVVVSVMKKAEDASVDNQNDIIIRLYEAEGKDGTEAKITLPSNIVSAKEVNLIEEEVGEAVFEGDTLTAEFNHNEIKTFRLTLANSFDYEDTKTTFSKIDLSSEFNLDGISTDEDRTDGDLDGQGKTMSADLIPSEVVSEDVAFDMGLTVDGEKNIVKAEGQKIELPEEQHKYLYILGTAAGSQKSSGIFTVEYADGSTEERNITFNDWTATIGGWHKERIDDTIGLVLTHNHKPGQDDYGVNNYLYVHKLPLNASKTVKSITLPEAGGIKIAAMSYVDSDSVKVGDYDAPTAVTNLTAEVPTKMYASYVDLSWDAADDNIAVDHYNVYRSTDKDFEDAELIAKVEETSYRDESVSTPTTYFYKVEAEDEAKNKGKASEIVSIAAGANVALGKPVEVSGSSSYYGGPGENAVDGDKSTMWGNYSYSGDGDWILVDLETATNIDKIILTHAGGSDNNKDFKIEVSSDKEKWTEVEAVTDNDKDVTKHELIGVNARYVKVTITEGAGWGGSYKKLREIEINAIAIDKAPEEPSTINSIVPGENGKVTINFAPVSLATSYKIKYGTEAGNYTKEVADITSTSYTIEGLEAGENGQQTYYFVVVATNPYGDAPVSEEKSVTVDVEAPSAVANLKAVTPLPKFSQYVDLSWDAATDNVGVDHYNVYRATKEDLSDKVLTASVEETSYRDEDADTPSKYYYVVKAVDATGSEGEASNKVSAEAGCNVSIGKTIEASGSVNGAEAPEKALDGDAATKWCDNGSSDYWIIVDLEEETPISKFKILHAGDAEAPTMNTREYKIEVSNDKENWTEAVHVTDNTVTKSEHEVTDVKGRYVRLYIPKDKSVQPGETAIAARIYEFKILAGGQSTQPTEDFTVTHKFNLDSLTAGEKLEAEVNVTNNTEESQQVKVIMALYDKNNTLVKVDVISSDIAVGEAASLKPAFDLPDNVDNLHVKVFVWNGTSLEDSNMIPLVKPIVMGDN